MVRFRINFALASGAASPNFLGAKVFDFRRATALLFGTPLRRFPKHKMTTYAKNVGWPWPPAPLWLRL